MDNGIEDNGWDIPIPPMNTTASSPSLKVVTKGRMARKYFLVNLCLCFNLPDNADEDEFDGDGDDEEFGIGTAEVEDPVNGTVSISFDSVLDLVPP